MQMVAAMTGIISIEVEKEPGKVSLTYSTEPSASIERDMVVIITMFSFTRGHFWIRKIPTTPPATRIEATMMAATYWRKLDCVFGGGFETSLKAIT